MFIDINYSKRLGKAKLNLAKPNKRIISSINEHFNSQLITRLGDTNELTFSIPYFIEDSNGNLIHNDHTDTIKERMLIRFSIGTYKEWFVVDEITESGEDEDVFNVVAYSLGFELGKKRISGLLIENENATGVIDKLLEGTSWSADSIDAIFDGMYRTFDSGEDSNILNCIIQWAETFGGLLIWDTVHRKISLKVLSENGRFKGLTVRHDRLIKTINKSRTTDEMVTRLYVEGNEGLTIHSVNPTGQGYIEDFSFFTYPFETDNLGNVLKSSNYMSDELCLALESHNRIVGQNFQIIKDYLNDLESLTPLLVTEETILSGLRLELDNIQQLLDLALATESESLIQQRQQEKQVKISEIIAKEAVVEDLNRDKLFYQNQINTLQGEIANARAFTPELLAELDPYIIESMWRDDRYINAQELYEDGIKKFAELREPKIIVDITIDNLMDIVEEQHFWDKITLGDYIKVKYHQINLDYMAKIMEISYDLDNREINLVVSNSKDLLSENEKLVQLLYNSKSATALVQNNKYKWDKVNALSDQVASFISNEWDATKNQIIAGINNSVEIGKRGIIIKNPDFPNEIIILQSGVIALSEDAGETWKTAIKPDGIVAERLIGRVIAGQELIITNSTGSFIMDENGAVFDVGSFKVMSRSGSGSSSVNLVDRWQNISTFAESLIDDNLITSYEKKVLLEKWNEIQGKYNANESLILDYFNGNNPSYVEDYRNAYNALNTYLFVMPHGEDPLLSPQSMEYTSRVVSETFNQIFNDYYDSINEFEKQMIMYSKALAESAQEIAQQAQDNINEIMDDVVYKIELYSSNGLIFRNGDIGTTITARVYRGKDDITSNIPNSGFLWRKYNKDGIEDLAWGTANIGIGNVITVTNFDVISKATFKCDIEII